MHFSSLLTSDPFLKIGMPLLTFTLGVLTTLWSKKVEKKNEFLRENIKAIVTLTNDWYNQLLDLRAKSLDPGIKTEEFQRAVFVYVHNRIILPKLLLSMEIVRKSGKYVDLLESTESFMTLVTTYATGHGGFKAKGSKSAESLSCRDVLATLDPDSALRDLDSTLQDMIAISAVALSAEDTRSLRSRRTAAANA